MREFVVVIVGAGPRGVGILERIAALIDPHGCFSLVVHVVDPGIPGEGVHRSDQPLHLLTNTTASQTTMFVDRSVEGAGPARPGPDLHAWLARAGCTSKDGVVGTDPDGDPLDRQAYVPRAFLGRYLAWFYERVVASMPANVRVEHHRRMAVGLARCAGSASRLTVALEGGASMSADFVFVTTGHAGTSHARDEQILLRQVASARTRNPMLAYIGDQDGTAALVDVPPEARVAICGTGLTSLDVVSTFTHGRGGIFEQAGAHRFVYRPSGSEPFMTLYSRQGLPAASKGVRQRSRTYAARFFTKAFVDAARAGKKDGRLDWNRDVLGCLKRELALCWEETAGMSATEGALDGAGAIERSISPWTGRHPSCASEHASFIRAHLEADVDAAFRGDLLDPDKAVAEVMRDLNDVVRHAVDHSGLTPDSHLDFLRDWVSVNNRLAAGPPKERNMEMLALIEAGILRIFEPDPVVRLDRDEARFEMTSRAFGYGSAAHFDVLVRARIGVVRPRMAVGGLFADGVANGVLTPFRNGAYEPSGIAIDRDANVVGADGRPVANCWALGNPVEGAHYYTYVLPAPGSNSRSLRDAGRVVQAMVSQMVGSDLPRRRRPDRSPAGRRPSAQAMQAAG